MFIQISPHKIAANTDSGFCYLAQAIFHAEHLSRGTGKPMYIFVDGKRVKTVDVRKRT